MNDSRYTKLAEQKLSIDKKNPAHQGDLNRRLQMLKEQALNIVRATAPYKRGDLSKSFDVRTTPEGFEIYTRMYYMGYTEGVWVSPQWRGRKNPNEAWFQETAEYIARYIAFNLGGTYVSNSR